MSNKYPWPEYNDRKIFLSKEIQPKDYREMFSNLFGVIKKKLIDAGLEILPKDEIANVNAADSLIKKRFSLLVNTDLPLGWTSDPSHQLKLVSLPPSATPVSLCNENQISSSSPINRQLGFNNTPVPTESSRKRMINYIQGRNTIWTEERKAFLVDGLMDITSDIIVDGDIQATKRRRKINELEDCIMLNETTPPK